MSGQWVRRFSPPCKTRNASPLINQLFAVLGALVGQAAQTLPITTGLAVVSVIRVEMKVVIFPVLLVR